MTRSRPPHASSSCGGPLRAEDRPILLTGGTGFIGRPLLRRLLQMGRRVTLVGRKAPDFLTAAERQRVEFLRCDLATPRSLHQHARRIGEASSAILAGGFVLGSTRPEDDDLHRSLSTNVLGTAALLDLLSTHVEWLGYVSTVDVYGQPDRRLIGESHRTRPGSYYGVSKLAGEGLVRVFAQRRGIPHAVLRLAQVYGPGDVSRKAIPAFVRAGLTSREITVHGPGTEQRSYLFVDDAVDACIAALDKRADGVFNVAGRPVSVLQVAQLTRRLLCLKRPVRRLRGKPRPSLALDAEAARRVLGFRARTRLDQGLRSVIKELSAV